MPSNATLAFLKCVLPSEGFYCGLLFDVPNPRPGVDKPRQVVCDTVEELAERLLAHDARGNTTVYHACASFIAKKGKGFRTHDNAKAARAFWLDIDAGEGKAYADVQSAAEAVLQFAHGRNLPRPLLVGSGRGIHAYWPLTADLDRPTWERHALGLKQLCAQEGLIADPTRTADISSVLRPVGTHHRKNGELVVTGTEDYSQYPIERFGKLYVLQPGHTGSRQITPRSGSILERIDSGSSYTAVYADTIANGCAQLDRLRRSGNTSEPQWYAALGVLARCEDGQVKAHEWSAHDYPGYSEQETQVKFVRAGQTTGATTCAHFDSINPGLCVNCPHWGAINSPISLGAPVIAQPTRTALDFTAPAEAEEEKLPPEGIVVDELPKAPFPFKWSTAAQLCFEYEAKDGDKTLKLVCEYPIFLDSVQTGELTSDNFSYRFQKFLPKHGWSTVMIDASALHGNAGIATMFGRGAVIHDAKMFLQYARVAVDTYNEETSLQTRFDQFGWKNDDKAFLFGKQLYTSVGPVEAIGAKEVSVRNQWLGPRKDANLIAWTEAADSLFAADMEAQSAVVLASFAAPLMKWQSADEGGAILHLFTPASGHGKTTALMGAWTVWGVREGLNLTNEDTRVSKPITLGTLGNLPVIYDELRDKDPETIRRFVVTFTEGRDRLRGMIDGTIRHTKANWQTVLLSAANSSLIEQLEHDGTDAPAFRVLELGSELSNTIDKSKGDKLKKVLNENAGTAGDAYLRYLLHPPVMEWSRAALTRWTDEIWKTTGATNAQRFRVRLIGAIAVASALVNKADILHFNTDRIIRYLLNSIGREYHSGTVSSKGTALQQATSSLGEFINDHYSEALVVADRWKAKQPKMIPIIKPQRRLIMRYEIATQRVFIAESALKDWCVLKQISSRLLVQSLLDGGVIVAQKRQVTLSAGTDIPGAQVMCIELNANHPVMSGLVAAVDSLQQGGSYADDVQGTGTDLPQRG